jgi:F0F1-type ATP synthase assembly protein I
MELTIPARMKPGEFALPHSESSRDSDGHGDPSSAPADERKSRAVVYRFLGLGSELSGFTLVFAGLGYLIDSASEFPKPYATAGGALIGFVLGMARFIYQVRSSDRG